MLFRFQKVADEETSEPFIARLWLGILELRKHALNANYGPTEVEVARSKFDSTYDSIMHAMGTCRTSVAGIQKLVADHQSKVSEGTIIRFQPNAYTISESIDIPLREHFSTFLSSGVRTVKGVQQITRQFGVDISCLFVKPANFQKGLEWLKAHSHVSLAQFLAEVRATWSEDLIKLRDRLEHEGWVLPPLGYRVIEGAKVEMIEPQIGGFRVSQYSTAMFNRIAAFVENVVVYTFQYAISKSDFPIVITEIPKAERDNSCPFRFRLGLRHPQVSEWEIKYSETDFP